MAINLRLSFHRALERLRPKSFAQEVSYLTTQAFLRLNDLGLSLEREVDHDIVNAVDYAPRKALHDETSRRYISLFDTLVALQTLADKHNGRR